jgi:hypothetical protein
VEFYYVFLIVATVIIISYYFFFHILLTQKNSNLPQKRNKKQEGVSVIIAIREHTRHIFSLVENLLLQDYPDFEIILVNDYSPEELIKELRKKYDENPIVRILKNPFPYKKRGKKEALTYGIRHAKNDILLFIDADCMPASYRWISLMATPFNDEKVGVVTGISPMMKKKGFFNHLIRFDSAYFSVLYAARALRGKPYMAVGRNLAYRKKLWNEVNGFSSHMELESGDDDLFLISVRKKTKVFMQTKPESFVYTFPPKNFKEWKKQKQRHFSTSRYYSIWDKLYLTGNTLAEMFWILSVLTLFYHEIYFFPLGLFIIRIFFDNFTMKRYLKAMGMKDVNIFTCWYQWINGVILLYFHITRKLRI